MNNTKELSKGSRTETPEEETELIVPFFSLNEPITSMDIGMLEKELKSNPVSIRPRTITWEDYVEVLEVEGHNPEDIYKAIERIKQKGHKNIPATIQKETQELRSFFDDIKSSLGNTKYSGSKELVLGEKTFSNRYLFCMKNSNLTGLKIQIKEAYTSRRNWDPAITFQYLDTFTQKATHVAKSPITSPFRLSRVIKNRGEPYIGVATWDSNIPPFYRMTDLEGFVRRYISSRNSEWGGASWEWKGIIENLEEGILGCLK